MTDPRDLAKVIYPFLVSAPEEGYHDRWPRPKRLPEFADAIDIAEAVLKAINAQTAPG